MTRAKGGGRLREFGEAFGFFDGDDLCRIAGAESVAKEEDEAENERSGKPHPGRP